MDNTWDEIFRRADAIGDEALEIKQEIDIDIDIDEEVAVKHISEAEELDTMADRQALRLYKQWVEKNTIEIPLWQGGVQPGKLNLLVAGTGVGKSTFLQNLAHHLAQKGTVLYISAEEDQGTIAVKLIETIDALLFHGDIPEEKPIKVLELKPSNKEGLTKQFMAINKKQYDFIVFDYIKSNLLIGELAAHESISQIVDAFYKTVVRPNLKTVCFAAIQTNSAGNNATPGKVAENYIQFVEGRAYAPRHASSVMFLLKDDKNSQVIMCKSRGLERQELNTIHKYSFGGLGKPFLRYSGAAKIQDGAPTQAKNVKKEVY